ncbi:hypothetical protein [Flavobacterium psychrotrophum]|uniref:hypothetical protein n=1 Tax=Flavobacterium psychrotrophum TaxID=2294119 RepID=UPI000E313EB6|nr:hypothetical protein [Flavobacterium psychrotrophum]
MDNTGHFLQANARDLQQRIKESEASIMEMVGQFETFDLLAAVFHYHQSEDANAEYHDLRGDKNFVLIEIAALACLKNPYNASKPLDIEDFYALFDAFKKETFAYMGYKSDERMDSYDAMRDLVEDPAAILQREALFVRNPALPDHHLMFSQDIYRPVEEQLTAHFGFSPADSITLRKQIPTFLGEKYNSMRDQALQYIGHCVKQIQKFKKKGILPEGIILSKEEIEEVAKYPYNTQRDMLKRYFLLDMNSRLGKIYSFSAAELAEGVGMPIEKVEAFLKQHSCDFPSLEAGDDIVSANSILKLRPFVHHNGRYLLISAPLMFWAPELHFETFIKTQRKLSGKYSKAKHDFTLDQARDLLTGLMPQAHFYPANLFYTIGEDRYESDTIFYFDSVLFIVEVKGHRISSKAKEGHRQRTQQHLKEIVKESYDQGIRTLEYIQGSAQAVFKTDRGKTVVIERDKFDEVVLLSITLEPIGNIAAALKTTNKMGFFKNRYFPWILSLYDLKVIADLITNPFVFIQYIRRRKEFLSVQRFQIYEELDLLGYYLKSGLALANLTEKTQGHEFVSFMPMTDAINNYYLHKFGHSLLPSKKPEIYLPKGISVLLDALADSALEHKVKIAIAILSMDKPGLLQFERQIDKAKTDFIGDGNLHDASLFSPTLGIGVTYMAHSSKEFLEKRLAAYCMYKYRDLKNQIWVGLGDTNRRKGYNLECMCYINVTEPRLL